MPNSTASATQPRPQSTVSTISDLSETSTLRPRLPSSSSARALAFLDTRPIITVADGSWARRSREGSLAVGGAAGKGHRPSLSLSSAMPSRPSASYAAVAAATTRREEKDEGLAPYPRPRTSLAIERPISQWTEFEDGMSGVDGVGIGGAGVVRRNSLSDLRIPARITSSQRRIEEDLERVKEFAKGVEGESSLNGVAIEALTFARLDCRPQGSPRSVPAPHSHGNLSSRIARTRRQPLSISLHPPIDRRALQSRAAHSAHRDGIRTMVGASRGSRRPGRWETGQEPGEGEGNACRAGE